jgi:hypothetical protein
VKRYRYSKVFLAVDRMAALEIEEAQIREQADCARHRRASSLGIQLDCGG